MVDPKTGERKQPGLGGFATRQEAEEACAEMITQYSKGELTAGSGVETVESFMRIYLNTVLVNELSERTFDQKFAQMENHIVPALGNIKLQKLTPMQVQSFINDLIDKGKSPGTIQSITVLLSQTLKKAMEWGYVTRNVATLTSKPSYKPDKHPVWSKEQFTHFLKSTTESHLYPFYLIALTTGMRPGEILALSWDKVDFKTGKIKVDCTVTYIKEKGIYIKPSPKNDTSRRTIPVPVTVLSTLKKIKMSQSPNEYNVVVPGINTGLCHSTTLRRIMSDDVKAAGLPPLNPHGLRHTFATYLLSPAPHGLGQSVTAVAELLGHSKTTTTWNTYSHSLPSMKDSIADQIDKFLNSLG